MIIFFIFIFLFGITLLRKTNKLQFFVYFLRNETNEHNDEQKKILNYEKKSID